MKNSPTCPNFDPQVDFSQFLEEARQHAKSFINCDTLLRQQGEEKKGKKSWKSKVLSWLKQDKKRSESVGTGSQTRRRSHVSGPLCGNGKKVESKQQRPVSGPISIPTFFSSSKRKDTEVPYMCLNNSPMSQSQQGVKPYGPVYLVT